MNVITATQLFHDFDQYTIVDVRTPMCYHFYHIPYSIHITHYDQCKNMLKKQVCFVCNEGSESQKFALQNEGAYYLLDGLKSWLTLNQDDFIAKKFSQNEICEGEKCEINKNLYF